MSQIMNFEHPRWEEFLNRLTGPEGCNFRVNKDGKTVWNCSGDRERPLATAILETVGDTDIETSLLFFDKHGGYCDCEILFNVNH